jgi:cadmium resistance protein CadD (predicted permease)
LAVAMSLITLIIPLETHPKLSDVAMIRGLFGWLMLYLGLLTVALAWFGLNCIWNKRDHPANRHWLNVGLLCGSAGAAVNCAWQGWQIGQMIMIGVAPVGVVAAVVFLRFIFRRNPKPKDYVLAHFRALMGAGISVYTAFLAFGAVQLMPSQAFNPILWCVPSVVGLSIVAYHEVMASAGRRPRTDEDAAHASGTAQSS